MPHLILLGDSIFDNAPYTGGKPAVISQVRKILPTEWNASLLAVDGATTRDIEVQTSLLPPDSTHLVLSVGGNDALMQASVLELPASSTSQAIGYLADVVVRFERDYRVALAACMRLGLPLALCTIYNGCFEDPNYQRMITTTLAIFNDAIVRAAIEHRLPVIDLRAVCASPEDYANPIEPSSVGGAKIAQALADLFTGSTEYDGAFGFRGVGPPQPL